MKCEWCLEQKVTKNPDDAAEAIGFYRFMGTDLVPICSIHQKAYHSMLTAALREWIPLEQGMVEWSVQNVMDS